VFIQETPEGAPDPLIAHPVFRNFIGNLIPESHNDLASLLGKLERVITEVPPIYQWIKVSETISIRILICPISEFG
jgi:hypothetical protein